jgi:hypothetical protein
VRLPHELVADHPDAKRSHDSSEHSSARQVRFPRVPFFPQVR